MSSDTERKMSSLTSRSFFTQALRSSKSVVCMSGCDTGEKKLGPAPGIGIFVDPSQWPHVPFAVKALLISLFHLAYSGPVASARRTITPGRRGDGSGPMFTECWIFVEGSQNPYISECC